MSQLHNTTQNKIISEGMNLANSFFSRAIGLMGKKDMDPNTSLLITRCNWIQTCFMKFSIDALFIDKKMTVKKVIYDLKPWRVSPLVLGACSVIEFKSGSLKNIEVGDQLHVVD